MTPKEFAASLLYLDITQKSIAERFGLTEQTISNYVKGKSKIPGWMPDALAGLRSRTDGHPSIYLRERTE